VHRRTLHTLRETATLGALLVGLVLARAAMAADTPVLMFEVKSGDRFGLEAPEGTQKVTAGDKVTARLYLTLQLTSLPTGYDEIPQAKLGDPDLCWRSQWMSKAELATGWQPIDAAVTKLIRSQNPGTTTADAFRWLDAQDSGELMLAYAKAGPGFISERDWLGTEESIRGMEVLTEDGKVARNLADAAPQWRFRIVQAWHKDDAAKAETARARTPFGMVDLRWSIKVTVDPSKTDVDLGMLKVSYNAKKLVKQNEQEAGDELQPAKLALSFIGLGGILGEAAAAAAAESDFDIVSGFVVPNNSPKMFYGVQFRPNAENKKALGVLAGHTAESEGQWVAALTAPIGDRGMVFAGGAFSSGGGETRSSACFGIGLRIDDLLLGALGKKQEPAKPKEVDAQVKVADSRQAATEQRMPSAAEDSAALVVTITEKGTPQLDYWVTPKLTDANLQPPDRRITAAGRPVAFAIPGNVKSVGLDVYEKGGTSLVDAVSIRSSGPTAEVGSRGKYKATASLNSAQPGPLRNTRVNSGTRYELQVIVEPK